MAVLQVTIAALLFLSVDDVAGQKSQNDPIPRHEAWTCSNTSNNTSLRLSCPDSTDWFHIVREEFSFTGNCTTGIYRNSSAQDTGSGRLSVSCLGPQTNGTCEETVGVPQSQKAAEKLVKITYECVKENLTYNICGNVSVQVGGVFYLASPDVFNQPLDNDRSELCRCVVETRSTVRAKLLYVANASNLFVSCTNCSVNSIPTSGRWINDGVIISSNDTEIKSLDISFHAFANGSHMENSVWVQIEGEGKMNLQCNGFTGLTTEALPTSPPWPNSNTNTRQDGDVHSDGQDHTRTNPTPEHAWKCSNTSTNTSLQLSCPDSTDWFHVVRKEFSFTGNCTTGIYSNASAQDTGSSGLSVSCLGPQTDGTCQEAVEIHIPQFQTAAEKLVKVTYECVKDDLNYNICDDVSLQVDGAFYLASPDFFTQPSDNDERQRCHCVLETRSFFRGFVLYLGNASNLLLDCTECHLNSVPSYGRWSNEGFIASTFDTQIKTLDISLKNVVFGNNVENSVWIKIEGEGAMNLQCNGHIGMRTESLPSSVSTPMPKSDTTDGVLSSDGADNTRKDTQAYVIAGVAGAVLIVLLVFLLIMIARRRQKMTKAEGDATEFQQNTTVRLQELAAPSSPDADVTSYASENYARLAPAEERNRSDDNATYTPLRPPVPRTSQGGNEHETHAPNCGAASEGPENHYYSSLARPEDRQGMDNDNYTLLPPRYVNFQQQQQPQRHQQQLRPVGAEDTIQYSNLITEQTAGDSPEAMDNTDDSYLHPVGCLTTTD